MAIYRNIRLSFWSDPKVRDDFTPEDKYFYLYLLTNPNTSLCGCYEVSIKSMTEDTGYNKDTIFRLLDRFETVHKVIKFNESTKEILIINWHKYNWNDSSKTIQGVKKSASAIKYKPFKDYISNMIEGGEEPVEEVVTKMPEDTNKESLDDIRDIVDYLNIKCGTKYRYTTTNTKKHIRSRIKEGYTKSDFYTVIDKKSEEWLGTDREKYLRPDTLFGSKFESYLNQKINKPADKNSFDGWRDA